MVGIGNLGLAGIEGGEKRKLLSFPPSPHTVTLTEKFGIFPLLLQRKFDFAGSLCLVFVVRRFPKDLFNLIKNLDRNEVAGSVLVEL